MKEITLEDDITTVVNTHDMNSVAIIGDQVPSSTLVRCTEGSSDEIETSDDELLKNLPHQPGFSDVSSMPKKQL